MMTRVIKGFCAVSLGLSLLTIGCGRSPSGNSGHTKDILFTDSEWREFRLTQQDDLVSLNGQPGQALAFYKRLARESRPTVTIERLDDLNQSVVDFRRQRLQDMGVPQSDSRWGQVATLQKLVNLRRDITDSGKTIYCERSSSPSGFSETYGVGCETVWDAFKQSQTPLTGSKPFHGFYAMLHVLQGFPTEQYVVCMVDFRPPTAKLACGMNGRFDNEATYDCPPSSANGCRRQSTDSPGMFPDSLEITVKSVRGLAEGNPYDYAFPFHDWNEIGFVHRYGETVGGWGDSYSLEEARKSSEFRAVHDCPADAKRVAICGFGQPEITKDWKGKYTYMATYACLTQRVRWKPLF